MDYNLSLMLNIAQLYKIVITFFISPQINMVPNESIDQPKMADKPTLTHITVSSNID